MTKLIGAYLILIFLQGIIVSLDSNSISKADTTTQPEWSETEYFPVYRNTRIEGVITANFTVNVNISLFNLEYNVSQTILQFEMSGRDGDDRGSFNVEISNGALISIHFQSSETSNTTQFFGIYQYNITYQAENIYKELVPYLATLIILLLLSLFPSRLQSLPTYIGKMEMVQSEVAVGIIVFSLTLLNPKVNTNQFSPELLIKGLLGNPFYPVIWWGMLAVISVQHFTTSSVDVQQLWTYPRGKKMTFWWRLVYAIGYISIIQLSVILSYLLIIYSVFIGYTLSWTIISSLMIFWVVSITKMTSIFLVISMVKLYVNRIALPSISALYLTIQNSGIVFVKIGVEVTCSQIMIQGIVVPSLLISMYRLYIRSEVLT